MTLTSKAKSVFISHRCLAFDHGIVQSLQNELQLDGHTVSVDPFIGGDRTCDKAQRAIKDATHFVLIATESSINREHERRGYQSLTESWLHARWVTIEYTCAELCAMQQGLIVICVKVGSNTPIPEVLQQFIHIFLDNTSSLPRVGGELRNCVSSTAPSKRISTDSQISKKFVNEGREAERNHAIYHARRNDERELHRAIGLYDEAILYDFCNHHAWINKGWCLWKLRSDRVAWRCINIAQFLRPDSDRLKQIVDTMMAGRRTLK